MLPPAEGPDLAIVREFDDDAAANLLTYQENGGVVCWKAVGKNAQTTPGYELAAPVTEIPLEQKAE